MQCFVTFLIYAGTDRNLQALLEITILNTVPQDAVRTAFIVSLRHAARLGIKKTKLCLEMAPRPKMLLAKKGRVSTCGRENKRE